MGLRTSARKLAAPYYRRALIRTRWVGVTGSVGKTTTVSLVSAVLSTKGPTSNGAGVSEILGSKTLNRRIMATRPNHKYSVIEVSVEAPTIVENWVKILRPDVSIVTTIKSDHRHLFAGDLDRTARVKSEIVRNLSKDGVAILNTDDPRVWAMRDVTPARVIGYGRAAEASVRIEDVSAQWPDRLALSVRHESQVIEIQTKFVGDYAAYPVAAALAAGIAEGISLTDAAARIAEVEPVDGRMTPVETADGISFIDNSWKSPFHILAPTLEFLESARAARKILVIGSLSDFSAKSTRKYRTLARNALEIADIVIVSGEFAFSVLKIREAVEAGRLMAFVDTAATNQALSRLLQPGDLVVLQGAARADHFDRITLDRIQRVDCWVSDCGFFRRCRQCPNLTN